MSTLRSLKAQYSRHCKALGVRRVLSATARHDGSAHVEQRDGTFHYVVTERGTEFERRVARDEDEMLYWLVCDVVFDLASQYELEHRIAGRDSRRLLFAREIELMASLNPAWAARKRDEMQARLANCPYDDAAD